MKKLFHLTHRTALYFSLSSLIALALGLSVLRFWLLPRVAEFRSRLETQIGTLLGETVRIDTLSARLHGFHPELSLTGFHILDPQGHAAITFTTVRLSLDTLRTLANGEPRFNSMDILGPKISIRRKEDGSLAVLGLNIRETPPAWLLAGGRIDLSDAEVDWQDLSKAGPPLYLGQINLRLRNADGRHRLTADFALPEGLGSSLRIVLNAKGDLFHADGWGGMIYLEGRQLDMARVAGALPPSPYGVRAGTAEVSAWARWEGRLQSLAGELHLKAPLFVHRPTVATENQISLSNLSSQFFWQRRDDGWRLDLSRFRPVLNRPWPETRLAVAVSRTHDGTLSTVSAAASHLDLGDLATLLHALPVLDEETGQTIRALSPRGTLQNLRLFYAPAALLGERMALCGEFRDLAINPWGSIPGASGLAGKLCGTDGVGRATLSAEPGSLHPAGLGLKRPIPFTQLSADLDWQQTATDWVLNAPSLSMRNDDFTGQGHFRTTMPKHPDASPFVDLTARLTEINVAAIKHYLPVSLLPDTSAWLEQALASGRVTNCGILFLGRTGDFPFYRNEGVFEAVLDAENVELHFHPDWLPLRQTDARLHFRGPGLEIDAQRGRIGEGDLVEAHAFIEDMDRNSRLKLTGTVHAGVPASLDFLAHSPIRDIPERLRKFVRVAGNADIALQLEVPLQEKLGDTVVDGTATFRQASLRIDDLDLEIRDIQGPLQFTRTGLSADGIRARMLDEPVFIDVDREDDDIVVDVRGRTDIAALRQQFPANFWRFAQGTTDFRVNLRLPETLDARRAPLRLNLSSNLAGIMLDLPAPFGKPEQDERTLSIETEIGADGGIPLRLAYGPDLWARLRFTNPEEGARLEGGDIAVGGPLPSAGREPGLALFARLDQLDAGPWRHWWADTQTEDSSGIPLRELQLDIGKLAWNGTNLGSFALELRRRNESFEGRFDSLYGKGRFRGSPEAVRFDLDTLRLPQPPAPKRAGAAAGTNDGPDLDPAVVPNLRIEAKRFFWRNLDLGPFALDTERHAHGMIVKALTVKTKTHALELHGQWTRTPNRAASTHLEGKVHINDLGDFLAAVGHSGEVRETAADLGFILDWPGTPHRFSGSTIAGEVRMKLGKGALLKIEPGLGRVLGMLDLDTIWRRLTFDFSDLFGKGLAYDSVGGTFRLGGGQAVTEGFLIDAVPAKILISGRAGLAVRDLDQVVTVIPHTSVALPIAGALAGGPAVGAAVLLAQRLVGEEVDSITATHYALKGSWDNPSITRISRNLPLDILTRAWGGVKHLSGFGSSKQEEKKE